MSRRKANSTKHSKERFIERTRYSEHNFQEYVTYASQYGKCPNDFDGDFGDYLKVKGKYKRLKVFDGYIWIFNKTSNRLITIYSVPKRFETEENKNGH